jgi:putative nucleotidyltransferase with HDIG domain
MARDPFALTSSLQSSLGRLPRRRKPRSKEGRRAAPFWRLLPLREWLARCDWSRVALLLGTIAVLSALLSLHLLPDKVALRVGEISAQDVRAFRTVRYLDDSATNSLRAAAAAQVEPVYSSAHASSEADEAITDAYQRLRRDQVVRLDPTHASADLRREVGLLVDPSALAPLISPHAGAYHLDQAERLTHQAVHDAMDREIRDDHPGDLAEARTAVAANLSASLLPRTHLPAVLAIARAAVQPNRLLDKNKTTGAVVSAERLVAPVYNQIFAGDIVIRTGQIVTPGTIAKLRALGLQNPRLDPGTVASIAGLVAFMVGLVCVWLAREYPRLFASTKTLLLLALLVTLGVLGLRLGSAVLGVRLSTSQFGYVGMLWVAATGMLIAALIKPRVAMLVTALLAAQSGLVLGSDLRFSILTLVSTWVAIYAVSDLRSRSDVLRAGGILCAANVVLSLLVGQMQGDTRADISQSIVWAFFSGVLSVALFGVSAALFERLFGITTPLGLLELSDPNRPLLRRFCEVAPGTYTHSILVGNLAVTAAEAIGADALLCRVGALYHDLGKMQRAQFFVENQAGGDNAHERLNPSLSALVVTAHVREGLEIAEQEKLPPIIKSFITEHHGTSLIRYFYHQQCAGDDCEAAPVLEQQFRYAGPKPQSRETAILMLADSVEAASRTLERPTLGRIEDLVAKIIDGQLADGQLDECDLTQRDLRGIREAFVRLLSGMLHSRIDYPEMLKEPVKRPSDLTLPTPPTHATLDPIPDRISAERPSDLDRPSGGSLAA